MPSCTLSFIFSPPAWSFSKILVGGVTTCTLVNPSPVTVVALACITPLVKSTILEAVGGSINLPAESVV